MKKLVSWFKDIDDEVECLLSKKSKEFHNMLTNCRRLLNVIEWSNSNLVWANRWRQDEKRK